MNALDKLLSHIACYPNMLEEEVGTESISRAKRSLSVPEHSPKNLKELKNSALILLKKCGVEIPHSSNHCYTQTRKSLHKNTSQNTAANHSQEIPVQKFLL